MPLPRPQGYGEGQGSRTPGKNTVERVSGARRWSVRMRWKASLQADCWCLGGPWVDLIFPKDQPHPRPAAWIQIPVLPHTLSLNLSFLLCEMGQECLLC